jgi:predicted site-specific integrase-resolvase
VEIKCQLDATDEFLLQILLFAHIFKIKIFKNEKSENELIMNAAEMLHEVKTQLYGSSSSLKLSRIYTLKQMFET